jgi:hypothetical protein
MTFNNIFIVYKVLAFCETKITNSMLSMQKKQQHESWCFTVTMLQIIKQYQNSIYNDDSFKV